MWTPRGIAVRTERDPTTGDPTGAWVYTGDCPELNASSHIGVIDARQLDGSEEAAHLAEQSPVHLAPQDAWQSKLTGLTLHWVTHWSAQTCTSVGLTVSVHCGLHSVKSWRAQETCMLSGVHRV